MITEDIAMEETMGIHTNNWIIQVNYPHGPSYVTAHTVEGKYSERDLPDYSSRNFEERGFTVGIGG